MFSEATIDRIKQTVVTIAVSAIIAVIPFYFQTKAMTDSNSLKITELQNSVHAEKLRIEKMEVSQAINDTEIEQIKASLVRIEQKIDRLIERSE